MENMQATICISHDLLETMTLGAVESYELGDGSNENAVEIIGYIWGYYKKGGNSIYYNLDKGFLSISSKRGKNSVAPKKQAAKYKNTILGQWTPYISLVGDFHTHPYQNLKEVKNNKGFKFSKQDLEAFRNDDYVWTESGGYPAWIVLTICKLQRVWERIFVENVSRSSAVTFDIGEFRIWINACFGYLNDNKKRIISDNIYIDFTKFNFYNPPSHRLIGRHG